ncbi:homing endonuclease [Rhizobium phage P9VFCI]|uniref:Homing endonuclease n=1 Tax=Rhizobium phage P9VFCI TaxID=2763531 RepID=A0A7G7WX83_9CAUD|nr:homing endonuclease [Rhizobium phage P9VFCI]QNH71827.1 homing endonuclease [Rhizobium phage P9VFCI]
METFDPSQIIQNKYFKTYVKLMESRKTLPRKKKQGTYYENHHMLPSALGGTLDPSNMVLLTAKEHFIAHMLLPKFTVGMAKSKMANALFRFMHGNSKKKLFVLTSSQYDLAKKILAGQRKIWEGKNHKPETISKMSEAAKRRSQNPEYLKKLSEGLRNSEKMKEANARRKGQKSTREYGPLSDDHKAKLSVSLKGRIVSGETKTKISEGNSKAGSLRDPNGIVHHFTKAYDLCSEHGLNPSKVSEVLKGHRPHHKGWTRVI